MALWLPLDLWKNIVLGLDSIADVANLVAIDHSAYECLKSSVAEILADDTWWKAKCLEEADRRNLKRYGSEPLQNDWMAAYFCLRPKKTAYYREHLSSSKTAACTRSLIYIGCNPAYDSCKAVYAAVRNNRVESFEVMIADPRVDIVHAENPFYRVDGHRDIMRIATCLNRLEMVKILLASGKYLQYECAFYCALTLKEPHAMIRLFADAGKIPKVQDVKGRRLIAEATQPPVQAMADDEFFEFFKPQEIRFPSLPIAGAKEFPNLTTTNQASVSRPPQSKNKPRKPKRVSKLGPK